LEYENGDKAIAKRMVYESLKLFPYDSSVWRMLLFFLFSFSFSFPFFSETLTISHSAITMELIENRFEEARWLFQNLVGYVSYDLELWKEVSFF